MIINSDSNLSPIHLKNFKFPNLKVENNNKNKIPKYPKKSFL